MGIVYKKLSSFVGLGFVVATALIVAMAAHSPRTLGFGKYDQAKQVEQALNPATRISVYNPAWSPDGSKILFDSNRPLDGSNAGSAYAAENVWVMNDDGSGLVPLTRVKTAENTEPSWSPDGRRIAFRSQRVLDGRDAVIRNLDFNVWVMNTDGSAPMPLTRLTADVVGVSAPAWSPDGRKIAFDSGQALNGRNASNTYGTQNIWIMNADGSNQMPLTRLTANYASCFSPTWSPDGTKIGFVSERAVDGSNAAGPDTINNIWVMNIDGSGEHPLTKLTVHGDSSGIAWSADGKKIFFDSARALDGGNAVNTNGTSNIWVMSSDGTHSTPLTKLTIGARSDSPHLSPDGTKIVFSSYRAFDGSNANDLNYVSNIWVINSDGTTGRPLTRITAAHAHSFNPTWSPDGSKVVFLSQRALDGSDALNANAIPNIWVVNADGSDARPLTRLTDTSSR